MTESKYFESLPQIADLLKNIDASMSSIARSLEIIAESVKQTPEQEERLNINKEYYDYLDIGISDYD